MKTLKFLLLLIILINSTFQVNSQTCSGQLTFSNCGGSFDDGSGSLNYGNNLNCSYLIQPPSPNNVTATFTSFSTEAGYDYLYIYDGNNSFAPLIGTYDGILSSFSVTSTTGALFLVFDTDNSANDAGWELTYSCGAGLCAGTTSLPGCTGSFDDGSSTSNYVDNMNCQWNLNSGSSTSRIRVTFPQFSTEANYDFVALYDGNIIPPQLIAAYSGTGIPPAVTSSSSTMIVRFTSDGSGVQPGFSANYSCVSNLCNPSTTITTCSGTLTDGSGTGLYQNDRDCRWLIQPPGAFSITLNFTAMDLEFGDNLIIYDGTSTSASVLGNFSGNTIPSSITSSTGAVYIVFETTNDEAAQGWSLNYTCNNVAQCSGLTTLTNCSGNFSDLSGPNNYYNNLNCSWLLQPAGANSVTLRFNSFNVSSGDQFTVYDGPNASSPSLGTFFGSFPPADITSSTGSMFVNFISNASTNAAGWDCSYTCNNGVGIDELNDLVNFNVYPNPNDGNFNLNLEFNSATETQIELVNIYGAIVKSWNRQLISGKIMLPISVEGLSEGIYNLNVITAKGVIHKSIIIKK